MITETGLKIEGPSENERNATHANCFKDVIREAFNVTDVIIAHHLVYVTQERHHDGFSYQIVEEIPSADTLLFDHDIAKRLWGSHYLDVLRLLACEPVETRDKLFGFLYYWRSHAA